MLTKTAHILTSVALLALLALAACASNQEPRIVQPTGAMQEIRLTGGMATQVELPDGGRVQSVTVGNPGLLSAERSDNIVSLIAKDGASGETNLIVREVDGDGRAKLFQYRIIVQAR